MEQPVPLGAVATVARVVSGGQSGVDRAALEVAARLAIPRGGWCPAGGWAEDLVEPPGVLALHSSLRPTESSDPAVRTRLNVRDSHATLVLTGGVHSPGAQLTVETAEALGRPVLVDSDGPTAAATWLRGVGRELTLNVAGPRASEWPQGYGVAVAFLRDLLGPAATYD